MALKSYKPTTPSQRQLVLVDKSHLHKGKPVKGPDGKVENWAAETAPPNGLYRRGWRKSALKEGDQITIEGFMAKDGSHTINARSLTFADGTNLDNATSDVRDATSRLVNRFPDGADAPVIVKADSNAQAIIQISVTSDTLSRDDLSALVDNTISERLAAVLNP